MTTRHGGVSSAPWRSLNLTKGTGRRSRRRGRESAADVRSAAPRRGAPGESESAPHGQCATRGQPPIEVDIWSDYDTLITDEPGVPLLFRFADCTPVLIYDPPHHALALVHSGWRGTVQAAAGCAVEALVAEYDSRPGEMIAAVGPSIGPCCYEVGEEVIAAVHAVFDRPDALLPTRNGGRRHFDLWAANRRWLVEAGVRQIEAAESAPPAARMTSTRTAPKGGRRAILGR